MAEIDPMLPQHNHELVSVVMPVHNAAPFLDEAIRSILGQTYRHFEFVIFDDGSTDGSTERLREWAKRDERIRLLERKDNLGPALSSNEVVKQARGSIIARMDADDISHPDRLRRELAVLNTQREAGLVGTLCDTIDPTGRRIRGPDLWRATRSSWFAPFPHGSIMYRREIFDRIGGYRQECEFWEDQDLVLRFAAVCKVLVIADPLYQHRHSWTSTRLASEQERVETSVDLMYRAMRQLDRGESYDQLLASRVPGHDRINPRVFVSLGSLILWAGGRPKMGGRLLRRGDLSLNFASVSAVLWAAWGSVSPATLRLFMRGTAAVRNAAARRRVKSGVLEWSQPTHPPVRPERTDGFVGYSPVSAASGRETS